VVQWYQYFRDICSWKLLQAPIVLGGVGTVVQIDESVMVRSKYHRGRHRRQRWVFGVYDPQQRQGYIQLVPRQDAAADHPACRRSRHNDMARRVVCIRGTGGSWLCSPDGEP